MWGLAKTAGMFSQIRLNTSLFSTYQGRQLSLMTRKSYRSWSLRLHDYWLFFIFIRFLFFAADIVELDLVLLLIFEYPICSAFFNARIFYKFKYVQCICFYNLGIKELLVLVLRHFLSFHKLILLNDPIFVIANCAFFNVVHHIVKPHIQARKRIEFALSLKKLETDGVKGVFIEY